MKIKSFLAASLVAVTFLSCSKDDENSNVEKQILNFESEKAMQDKIAEIEAFKNNQEQQILQKILRRNNLSAPTSADIQNASKVQLTEADKAKVLEGVKFYHQEKLKALYTERAHFGFTSLQSIADEINFNVIVNKNKAEELLNKYNKLIVRKLNLATPLSENTCNVVLNADGEVIVNNKKTDFNNNSNKAIDQIKQGVLATNNGYAITYHAGLENYRQTSFTQFGSFLNGALYPSWFYPTTNSRAYFFDGTLRFLDFPGGANNIVRKTGSTNGGANLTEGLAAGNFVTAVNGVWISASGSVSF